MLIRCEKCSTLYELDDRLLPPQGAPVQCSKCQFVFKAYPVPPPKPAAPERAANDTPEELPAEVDATEPPLGPRDEVVREGGALASRFDDGPPVFPSVPPRPVPGGERPYGSEPVGPRGSSWSGSPRGANGDEPKFTVDGRPIRKVPFPVSEAPHVGPRTSPVRPAAPKGGLRATLPLKWAIAVLVGVLIVVVAAIAWRAAGPDRSRDARPGQSRALPQGGTPETPPRK